MISAPAAPRASRSRKRTPRRRHGSRAVPASGTCRPVSSRTAPAPQMARMSALLPPDSRVSSLAVSPDGRTIAMVLRRQGKEQIWVRSLDALEPVALAGTDGAADPFWSPDSQWIGFFADARLKKVDRSGGPVQTLCDALGAVAGPGINRVRSSSARSAECRPFRIKAEHHLTSRIVTGRSIRYTCAMASITWPEATEACRSIRRSRRRHAASFLTSPLPRCWIRRPEAASAQCLLFVAAR